MSSVLESLFFAVGEDGLSIEELESILEIDEEKLNEELDILKKLYEKEDRGITLKLLGNKYKLVTKAQNKEYIKKLTEEVSNTLSKSALETLAIIAYKGPITKTEIENIRGVSVEKAMSNLLEKNLVYISGKRKGIGTPNEYRVTDEFYSYLNVTNEEDLPGFEEFSRFSIVMKNKENENEEELHLISSILEEKKEVENEIK